MRAGKQQMVEAGGQCTRSFRLGLDYAFIPASDLTRMRSVLSGRIASLAFPDPSAHPQRLAFSVSL